MSRKFPSSVIVFEGKSLLDDAPIVGIVTGLRRPTNNPKTGKMAQLWILRADMSPLEAIDARADYAVCGDCKLRGRDGTERACYVAVKNAPLAVYRAYKRGTYARMEPADVAAHLRAQNLPIRFGAYGEPVALPVHVLNDLAQGTDYTGYTHQWSAPFVTRLYSHLLMASVDTVHETTAAQSLGWRTFRTRPIGADLMSGEIMCPASDEMQHRTTCAKCCLCDGVQSTNDRRRNISIVVHGSNKVHFMKVLTRNGAI